MNSRRTPLIIIAAIIIAGVIGVIAYATLHNNSSSTTTSMPGMDMSHMGDMSKPDTKSVSTDNVAITNFAFSPANITVKVGTKVTWTNKDSVQHSATADDHSFDTGLIAQNGSASYTFTKPGTYHYHCTPHPYMKGIVTVTP